jgi:uncharacterized protein (DUF58 family)
MIVPQNRLLVCAALVTFPLGLLVAARPDTSAICALIAAVFGAIVLFDAWRAPRSLSGIAVELSPLVRMSKDREGKLEVRVQNTRARMRRVRLGLDVPAEVSREPEEKDVVLPADSQWSRLDWNCTPVRRGRYVVESAYLEAISAFGLWAARKRFPVNSEIRVYPNLMTERRHVAALFMNRGAFGIHAERQIGRGRDFEKLREYLPGDSFDEIHWKASARRAKPVTKVFQIERTQEIYVVIDASRLSARTAGNDSILEKLVTAALLLGVAAERQGDLYGLLAFSDRIETFVRAKNGKAHYGACRDALYRLQPRYVAPDFDELCSFLRLRLRRRALIVFLTSLDDPVIADSFVRNIELLRRQHLVLVNMIRQLGVQPLFSDPKLASVDELYRHLGGHLRWHKLRGLEKTLERRGVRFSLLERERLTAELITQYLTVKQRQLI